MLTRAVQIALRASRKLAGDELAVAVVPVVAVPPPSMVCASAEPPFDSSGVSEHVKDLPGVSPASVKVVLFDDAVTSAAQAPLLTTAGRPDAS